MSKELDVETDDVFQKRDWRAERFMWILMLLFVLAGISGLFGRGGLSDAKAGSPAEKIEVEYQRFLRFHTKDRLDITLYNIPQDSKTFSLEFDKAYLDKVEIEDINPEPEKVMVTPNGSVYIFENQQATQAEIIVYLHPDKLGSVETALRFNNQNEVRLSQYIYP